MSEVGGGVKHFRQEGQICAKLIEDSSAHKLLGVGIDHVLKVLAGGEDPRRDDRIGSHPHLRILFLIIYLEAGRRLFAQPCSKRLVPFLAPWIVLVTLVSQTSTDNKTGGGPTLHEHSSCNIEPVILSPDESD